MKSILITSILLVGWTSLASASDWYPDEGPRDLVGRSRWKRDYCQIVWKTEPHIEEVKGQKKAVGEFAECENGGSSSVQLSIQHTLEVKVRSGWKDKIEALLVDELKKKFPNTFTTSKNQITSLDQQFHLAPARGRAMFTETLVIIKGTAGLDCWSGESEYEVIATKTDLEGKAVGTYSIEYLTWTPFQNDKFYELPNKDIPLYDVHPFDNVNSTQECAELTIKNDKNLAVYQEDAKTCLLKSVEWGEGEMLNKWGISMGFYDVPGFEVDNTTDEETREAWVQEGKCDTVHAGLDQRYWCRVYPEQLASVVMFRYNKTKPDFAKGANAHVNEKFFNLQDKDVPSLNCSTISQVKSAHDCGELAIESDKNLAVYRGEIMTCYLKDVEWAVGEMFSKEGKSLGTYDISPSTEHETASNQERSKWIAEGKCDAIHTGPDGRFFCKIFQDQPGSVLMLRFNETRVEMNKGSNKHVNKKFYNLHGKDIVGHNHSSFGQVKTAHDCGSLAEKNNKDVAVYRGETMTCVLKNVRNGFGELFDGEGHEIGPYDVPSHKLITSRDDKLRQKWIEQAKCDVIHLCPRGCLRCRVFFNNPGSVLMFRYR